MKNFLIAAILCISSGVYAQEIVLKNDLIQRTLAFDGKVWRTVKFSNRNGNKIISIKSDEFAILPLNGDEILSILDFIATKQPAIYAHGDTSFVVIQYKPGPHIRNRDAVPQLLSIKYYAMNGQYHLRKSISLFYDKPATIDRLEVERFIVNKQATGGRGEPVFVDDQWFFGLEYPAGYSRHTDGNTPKDYSRHYEKVGNYSYIYLEGRDIESNAVLSWL